MFSAMIGRCIFATKSERIVAQKYRNRNTILISYDIIFQYNSPKLQRNDHISTINQ